MNKRKYIINLLLAMVALLVGCNESLEDTYSDYAGDGKIRYVAKCSDLDIVPGWERLILSWVNGTDATIDKIKVAWMFEGQRDSVYLPGTATSYELTNLVDGTYQFYVSAVDKFGNESLVETYSGRPYTRDHELMRSFSRGILKSFFVNGKMIFFSDQYSANIVEIKLQYKNSGGETKYYEFENPSSYDALITIDDVSMNPADSVYILRKGTLENSPDTVVLDPVTINRKKNFSAGFVHAITARYGYSTETQEKEDAFLEFIENVEELELDYSIESLEDILFCTNLKKLVVGKNRHFVSKQVNSQDKSLILKSPEKSYAILEKAAEADVLGLKVDYYGHNTVSTMHYFNKVYPFMTYMGYSAVPDDLEIIPASALKENENGDKVYCDVDDVYMDWDALVDGNVATAWSTSTQQEMRIYEMYMELKETTSIRGIKVTQIQTASDRSARYFMPEMIVAQTSADGGVWKDVTFLETNELGRALGEATLLKMPEGSRDVRYVRLTLRDGIDLSGNWACRLGDIVLYK